MSPTSLYACASLWNSATCVPRLSKSMALLRLSIASATLSTASLPLNRLEIHSIILSPYSVSNVMATVTRELKDRSDLPIADMT